MCEYISPLVTTNIRSGDSIQISLSADDAEGRTFAPLTPSGFSDKSTVWTLESAADCRSTELVVAMIAGGGEEDEVI